MNIRDLTDFAEFVATLDQHLTAYAPSSSPVETADMAVWLRGIARTLHREAERYCNTGDKARWDAVEGRLDAELRQTLDDVFASYRIQRDPRGVPLYLILGPTDDEREVIVPY